MSEKRFNPSTFDSKHEVWDLLEKQAIIIEDLEEENEQLKGLYKVYEKAEEVEEKAKDCLIDSLKKENEQLRKEKIEANAFIVENGLAEKFVKWTTCIVGENDE